ncbi:phosphonopyruvate decarboxylase [Cupriavidus sp. 30B13]|uniref:phosphonopyruvate decarboxylase n=1 Tax=Cupriavidus sp. 30B13 TaxID=3384241 RepID=UPI003B90D472
MATDDISQKEAGKDSWPHRLYGMLKAAGVAQMSYVPDAGHTQLINLMTADPGIAATVLTTEEEGVAMAAGAWLGGQRSVLLMQSSGVGNCINMLSLISNCRFPFLTIITMRGEWAEFNPWQVPMGRATDASLGLMGVHTIRIESEDDLEPALESALTLAFDGDMAVAVILSQQFLGRKKWIR